MILQTTLSLAAAAAMINLWLALRTVQRRSAIRALHGDGGDGLLLRRMRAQANFVENTPFVLILIGAIELSGRGGAGLAIAGAVYMLARVAHAFGMDKGEANILRMIGFGITALTLVGLAAMAVLVALGRL